MKFEEILYSFLNEKKRNTLSQEELEFLFVELKKIIYFAVQDFLKNDVSNYKYKLLSTEYICGGNYQNKIMPCVEEIFPLLIVKIIKEKERIIKVLQNKKQSYIKSYLKQIVVRNLILDPLKKYPYEKDEEGNITEGFDVTSIEKPENEENSTYTKKETLESKENVEIEAIILDEANNLLKLINENLTDKEKKVLCFDEYKLEECIKDSSKDATYKGRERYRKKIEKIMIENKVSYEIFDYLIEKEYLMSEVCRKICL